MLSFIVLAFHLSVRFGCSAAAECATASITTVTGHSAPRGKLCPKQLIFEDNFNSLNASTWLREATFWSGGNGEFQWYTDSEQNAYTRNGILAIQPTLTVDVVPDLTKCDLTQANCERDCTFHCNVNEIAPPIRSARLNSVDGFAFKYGRLEIRAKLPTGDWLWPGLWLLPVQDPGEIDVMEARGNRNYTAPDGHQIGVREACTTLHFGGGRDPWEECVHGNSFGTEFHVYEMEWTPAHLTFSLDRKVYGTQRGTGATNVPFNKEFYLLLNLAVGSTNGYFPDEGNVGGKPWRNAARYAKRDFWNGRRQWLGGWNFDMNAQFSSALLVDYVRVYAL